MSEKTAIQWTDSTWNIARGCTKVDSDCKYCYMYRDSFANTRYDPGTVIRTKTVFDLPLRLKTPSKIFTCSLTDFFHEAIDSYRDEAWDIIRKCPQHTFQILTKRPERIADHLPVDWGEGWENVWLGTSCGSQKGIYRIAEMIVLTTRKPIKTIFLSLEPLYENINFNGMLKYFDWVIIGGESGNETGRYRYRPCKLEWIEQIVRQCKAAGVPVFVKQMGTHLAKELGMSDRHGGNIEEFPAHLQIREFPQSEPDTTDYCGKEILSIEGKVVGFDQDKSQG